MGLFLGFLSCSIGLYFCFCASTILSWWLALEYNLKSGRLIPPAPCFFLKAALAILGILCFHVNCEMFCSSSVKNVIGNLIGIALNLQIAFGSIVIFTILILSTQENGVSLHLFMLPWFLSFSSVQSLSCVWLFVIQWSVVYQAPPSIGFSRQEYWSGLPFPSFKIEV